MADVFRCRTYATGATPAFASGHDASGTPRKRTRHTTHPYHRERGQGIVNIHAHKFKSVVLSGLCFFVARLNAGRVYWLLTAMTRRLRKRLFRCSFFFLFHITTTSNKIGRLDGSLRQRLLTEFQKETQENIFKVSRLLFFESFNSVPR